MGNTQKMIKSIHIICDEIRSFVEARQIAAALFCAKSHLHEAINTSSKYRINEEKASSAFA